MIINTTSDVIFYVILIVFGGMLFSFSIALYISYTKMNLMLSHLQRSPAITTHSFLINTGPWGRLYLLGKIMGLMTMPTIYLRDGGASAEDLNNFPVGLKRKLIVLQWFAWFLLLVMIGVVAVIKLWLA